MKGLGSVDGIFAIRQVMVKQMVIHMALIDLEKAYDRVRR
jgi:hypothetical protein